jgi:hypothetical protein
MDDKKLFPCLHCDNGTQRILRKAKFADNTTQIAPSLTPFNQNATVETVEVESMYIECDWCNGSGVDEFERAEYYKAECEKKDTEIAQIKKAMSKLIKSNIESEAVLDVLADGLCLDGAYDEISEASDQDVEDEMVRLMKESEE